MQNSYEIEVQTKKKDYKIRFLEYIRKKRNENNQIYSINDRVQKDFRQLL